MYFNGESWVIVSPGNPMFSTATMVATHYLSENQWKDIFESLEDD